MLYIQCTSDCSIKMKPALVNLGNKDTVWHVLYDTDLDDVRIDVHKFRKGD